MMKTFLSCVISVISISFCLGFDKNITVEYYQDLICQGIAESETYIPRTDNSDFARGLESDVLSSFGDYDFIIVGSGSAGSVLANRLSEIDSWRILLLEAGGNENDFNNIPAMSTYVWNTPQMWGYMSTPQWNSCLNQPEARCPVYRGKTVGGTSSVNGLIYSRGRPAEYDQWVDLGLKGWAFDDVLPYFLKSENSQIKGDDGYHESGGFWNVEYSTPISPFFGTLVEANAQLGQSYIEDYNGDIGIGVSRAQMNQKRGRRQSLGSAFLDNARQRSNLHVHIGTLVTKLLVDPDSKTAYGIEFVTSSGKYRATTSKEVLVSAGAINSPQLLMLSGIGPRDQLEALGITVIEDLPVGKNLMDHVIYSYPFLTNAKLSDQNMKTVISQYLKGVGPLTRATSAVGFINTIDSNEDIPDIEYVFIDNPIILHNQDVGCGTSGILSPLTANMVLISFGIALLHEKSRGSITLKSNDPIDFPDINLNYLSEPEDIDTFISGINFIRNLTQTEAFMKYGLMWATEPTTCGGYTMYSKAYWECALREQTSSSYHYVGTTAMSPNRTTGVVDRNCNVHGIQNLRVVDAGVIPTTLSGHTSAPTVMIAEKIADVIKQYYDE